MELADFLQRYWVVLEIRIEVGIEGAVCRPLTREGGARVAGKDRRPLLYNYGTRRSCKLA